MVIQIIIIFKKSPFLLSHMDKEIVKKNIDKLKYALIISGIVISIVHIISPYFPLKYLWGFNFFRFIPLPFQIGLVLLGFLICIPYLNNKINKKIIFILNFLNRFFSIFSTQTFYIILSCIFFLIFWLLRSRRLYGDGVFAGYVIKDSVYLTIDGLYNSIFIISHFLISHLYKTLSGVNYPYGYFVTFALINCLLGSLFIIPLLLICKEFTDSIHRRFFIFFLILSQGGIQIFFGHVESYAIPLTGGMFFILLSFYYIQGKTNIFLPIFFLVLTCTLKITTVLLYPALIILVFLKSIKNRNLKSLCDIFIIAGIPFLGLVTYLVLAWKTGKLKLFLNLIFFADNFFPIINPKSHNQLYTLISWDYPTTFFNELALIFPMGILLTIFILYFYRKKIDYKEPFFLFLLSMSFFCILYNLVSYPILGPFRDWDKYSLTFLPVTLLGAYLLNKYIREDKDFFPIALLVLTFSLIHTAPWIWANNQKTLSLKPATEYTHVRDYLTGENYIKSSVKTVKDNNVKNRNAISWFTLAAKFDANLGGDNDKIALRYYQKAIEEDPNFVDARNNLGVIYDKMEKYNEASDEFRKALEIDQNSAEAHNNLGILFADWMWWNEAYYHHKKAAELNPDLAQAHNNLGIDYASIGRYKESIEEFKKALTLAPDLEASQKYLALTSKIIKK